MPPAQTLKSCGGYVVFFMLHSSFVAPLQLLYVPDQFISIGAGRMRTNAAKPTGICEW